MRTRITLIFLFLATVFVFFVLKSGYLSFDDFKSSKSDVAEPAGGVTDYAALIKKEQLFDYKGEPVDWSSFDNHKGTKVLHLWASWCGPCVNEVPEIVEYANSHPEIKFVTISLDEDMQSIEKFLKSFPKFGDDTFFKIWDNNKKLTKILNADRLPMTVILKDGEPAKFIKSVVDWKTLGQL